MCGLEVVHAEEQADAASELLSYNAALVIPVSAGKEKYPFGLHWVAQRPSVLGGHH
jgi:hypothetical protein